MAKRFSCTQLTTRRLTVKTAYPAERPQFSIADATAKRGYTSARGISLRLKDLAASGWPLIHDPERSNA